MPETKRKLFENVQYIRLTKELIFEDRKGRHTILSFGVPGFILNETNIEDIYDLTEKQRKECFENLLKAQKQSKTFALVQGYPCILKSSDFTVCAPPKIYPVLGEII